MTTPAGQRRRRSGLQQHLAAAPPSPSTETRQLAVAMLAGLDAHPCQHQSRHCCRRLYPKASAGAPSPRPPPPVQAARQRTGCPACLRRGPSLAAVAERALALRTLLARSLQAAGCGEMIGRARRAQCRRHRATACRLVGSAASSCLWSSTCGGAESGHQADHATQRICMRPLTKLMPQWRTWASAAPGCRTTACGRAVPEDELCDCASSRAGCINRFARGALQGRRRSKSDTQIPSFVMQ